MLFLFFVLFCFMVFLLHFAKFRYCISLVDHVNLIIHYKLRRGMPRYGHGAVNCVCTE